MTNEEITLMAVDVIQSPNNGLEVGMYTRKLREGIEQAIRKAVDQAYEEAAQAALHRIVEAPASTEQRTAFLVTYDEARPLTPDEIAARIRALKSSVQETVSS